MAGKYDTRTTIFSPQGRLYQVEYAMEAISHAGTCLGIKGTNGIVVAAEKKYTSKLLVPTSESEKIFRIHENLACSVAGITADANILINNLRVWSQRHLLTYQESMPIEELVTRLCDVKQSYTQFGGLRPFGVSLLYMGWDKHHGLQLYQSDPSGNYGGWKAACIGSNSQAAQSIMKQDYKEDMTLDDAIVLAVKVLTKTMDSTTLKSDRLEFATLTVENGKSVYTVLPAERVQELLNEGVQRKKDEEAAAAAAVAAKEKAGKAKSAAAAKASASA